MVISKTALMNPRVIRANYKRHAMTPKFAKWMGLVLLNGPREPVANRAHFYTNLSLKKKIHHDWIFSSRRAVTNSIGTKQLHCCTNVFDAACFASMDRNSQSEPIFGVAE